MSSSQEATDVNNPPDTDCEELCTAAEPHVLPVTSLTNHSSEEKEQLRLQLEHYPIKLVQQACSALPGILMVVMFGYTYVAIVTFDNEGLSLDAGFLLGWSQISNISITLSAGIMGSTKWAIGGANTTSAIILSGLLKNSNLETALIIQGISSLFVALIFILSAQCGGVGRLFGDKNQGTALYADYIHPSLVMALSQATALFMIKYSLELAVEGNPMDLLNIKWWYNIFSPKALSIWLPAWIIGGSSAFLDMRLQKQGLAMGLLLGVPLITFIIVISIWGLENIPRHFYWEYNSALESARGIDFSLIDSAEVARNLPMSFISAILIFAEAMCVYKSWSVVIPERRSVKADSMSCGVAHIIIAACGGWLGHQTFVESLISYRAGFRWSRLGAMVELASFGGFAVLVFVLKKPPPFPTILLSATVFYLACVFIDIWFLKRLPPTITILEWVLSSAVIVCVLVFGFNQGLAIGLFFLTILVYVMKVYARIVLQSDYDPSSGEMKIILYRHMTHGNTTEVFDLILEAQDLPRTVIIDLTQVTSADSAMFLFFQSITQMSKLESIQFVIQHSFLQQSSAMKMLNNAAEASHGMLECIFLDTKNHESHILGEP